MEALNGPASALGPRVAQGRTASVYVWRDGQVLKLFGPEFDRVTVEHEAHVTRAARSAGAPAPEVGAIVEVDGRFGLIYERVVGVPMSEVLTRQPWKAIKLGRRFARLQAKVHGITLPPAMPALHSRLEVHIGQSSGLPHLVRLAALEALADLPHGERLCHGDFHPANVLMGVQCDTVIDWADGSRGHPVADVARTATILLGEAQRVSGRSAHARSVLRRFYLAYLAEYRQRAGLSATALALWRPLVAAARLGEGVDGLASWLLAQALRINPMAAASSGAATQPRGRQDF